jgi:peptide/nickel transport system substrate-binding protein
MLYGQSIVLDSYIPPEHPLYAEERLTTYRYDPARGVALLEEMGWVDTDEDGIREAQDIEGVEDGTPLAFKWQAPNANPALQYLPFYQEDLAACGIDVDTEYLPAGERFFEGPEDPLFGRTFDLASFAWLTGILPPCNLYLSAEIPGEANAWDGHNAPGFINEAFDAACKRARAALPGTETYSEAHKEAQRIFSEQLPALPLFLYLDIAVIRNEVTGFILDPTQQSEIWNVEAFDLTLP